MLPGMTRPDLSIIIVSWNTRDVLDACLASLPSAVSGLSVEVIVADNDSCDGTPAMLAERHPAVTVLPTGGNLGFTRANNLALARTTGHRLLLLNPDTECPPGSLAALCDRLDALPDAAAVGCAQIDRHGAPTACWGDFPRPWHHWRALLDPAGAWLPHRWRDAGLGRTAAGLRHHRGHRDPATGAVAVDYVKGSCLLMTRHALDTVGPLDDRFFMYFEETDWCRRAATAGLRVYLCPDVAITHHEGLAAAPVSDFAVRQFHHSLRLFVAKHEGEATVAAFRRALHAEYTVKALLRRALPGLHNQSLAARYAAIASLQHQDDLTPTPPTRH
jgi:N-acetylglucosaminyl-diphospho-decaprenol L-rhamnosyltransferase